jgi:hypothetical protein
MSYVMHSYHPKEIARLSKTFRRTQSWTVETPCKTRSGARWSRIRSVEMNCSSDDREIRYLHRHVAEIAFDLAWALTHGISTVEQDFPKELVIKADLVYC